MLHCRHALAVLLVLLLPPLSAGAAEEKPAVSPLFPLPSLDGKPLAATEGQRRFRVPMRMARVEKFYRDRFGTGAQVTFQAAMRDGRRTVTLVSRRKSDAWAKAVLHEEEVETVIDVTPVLRGPETQVEGNGRPLVELVITRSDEVRKMVESIDHMEKK